MKICFLFGLILLAGCREGEKHNGKTVFRYNEAANITSLDPVYARDQAIIWATNQLFNGLVQLDDQLIVKPCIARSWEISSGGREYRFHLRTDVWFHTSPAFGPKGSRKVVAGDFVFSFLRILEPGIASPGVWIFNSLDKNGPMAPIEAINDSLLVIRLKEPFPPFIGLLSMQYCSVLPREAVEFYGKEFRRNPVGTGPFCFKYWMEGVKLVMVKNQRYFEVDGGNRLPYLDAVTVTFVPDKQTAFLDFMKGKLDFLSGLDATYKDELLTRDGKLQVKYRDRIRLITQPYLNTEYLGCMVDPARPAGDHPLLSKKVRQAISHSFDRRKMIRYLRNNIGIPGLQGITPKGLPSFDSVTVFYDYDPAKASILLKEAGFPGGKGLPEVTLTSTPDYLDICKYIQRETAALGIDLKIDVGTPAAVKEMKAEARLPFFRASWIADYPEAENYLSMFYSGNFCPDGPNYTHFKNPEFDNLYLKSLSTPNDSVRYAYYRKMEALLMEEAPVIILYYDQVLRFVHQNIEGLGSNAMNLLNLKRVIKR